MKILHISYSDKGGAANSCIRLHQGLLKIGVQSKLLVLQQNDDTIPESYKFFPKYVVRPAPFKQRLKNKLVRLAKEFGIKIKDKPTSTHKDKLKGRPEGFEAISDFQSEWDITQDPHYQEADIINLHWVAGFIDYPSFFEHNTKPVVWTLHDMNPFTGGCHYAGACKKYLNNCQACPQLQGTIDENYSLSIFEGKKEALAQHNQLVFVQPSVWLHEESRESKLLKKFPHQIIKYSLDTDNFKFLDTTLCRQLLNIPTDKKVVLFVADSLNNRRKGFQYLLQALQLFGNQTDLVLCSVGKLQQNSINENQIHIGRIKDERLMNMVYAAADVFIIPSLEDNLPNTVIESLCAGTPVIGFPIGGIVDMVSHRHNGMLTQSVTAESLFETIQSFFSSKLSLSKKEISDEAIANYALNIQAEKYIKLYETWMP